MTAEVCICLGRVEESAEWDGRPYARDLGHRAGKAVPRAGSRQGGTTLAARAREAATAGFVKAWKWNRARKKSAEKT